MGPRFGRMRTGRAKDLLEMDAPVVPPSHEVSFGEYLSEAGAEEEAELWLAWTGGSFINEFLAVMLRFESLS